MLCVCLAGCLEPASPAVSSPDPAPAFEPVPTDPISEAPALLPEPDPFVEVAPVAVAGFTGVRCYGNPSTCNPCRLLKTDLRWLAQNHGWSVSDRIDVPADWQFLPERATDERIPLIEFWRDGRLFDVWYGYSSAEDFEARKDALRELVRRHPRRTGSGSR